jgi:[ribosomal protein S5]-alanine N-acetyltransferase
VQDILTDRMKLRPLAAADAADLFAARRDVEVMSFWDGPPDASLSDTKAVVDSFLSEMRSGNSVYWAIRRRDVDSFVGVCDLSDIRAGDSADVGFMLARECWGRGLGTELVKCLIAEAQSRGLRALTARIHAGNRRSERLLLRSGFCIVNEMRGYEIRPGIFRDCLWLRASLPT